MVQHHLLKLGIVIVLIRCTLRTVDLWQAIGRTADLVTDRDEFALNRLIAGSMTDHDLAIGPCDKFMLTGSNLE
jgi:hypothetical protein